MPISNKCDMCTSPNICYTDGTINPKTGKRIYHFKMFNPELLEKLRFYKEKYKLNRDYALLPCGHCIECRLQYRRQWSIRLLHELKVSDNAWFLTITYDNDHLPPSKSVNKLDVHNFLKAIDVKIRRYYYEKNVSNYPKFKYFLSGEYGGNEEYLVKGELDKCRPHYHAILFNFPFNDFTVNIETPNGVIHKKSHKDEPLYQSKTLDKLWSKGIVLSGKVTYNSCSYVAGYVQKKLYGDMSMIYHNNLINPPFLLCSKKLGYEYFKKNIEKFVNDDELFYFVDGKVHRAKLPRYYLKVLEKEDPISYQWLKNKRAKANNTLDEIIDSDYQTLRDYYKSKKISNERKNKALIRK